jgi:DNA-binding PadR family transcriptional regulator
MRLQTDTKALVLSVLANGPKHGYGIAKAIRENSDGVLKLGEGQLYPALHALEDEGWVTAEWDSNGDQSRRIYAITPAGSEELSRRAERWNAFATGVAKIMPSLSPATEVN